MKTDFLLRLVLVASLAFISVLGRPSPSDELAEVCEAISCAKELKDRIMRCVGEEARYYNPDSCWYRFGVLICGTEKIKLFPQLSSAKKLSAIKMLKAKLPRCQPRC